jgi:hypothetical protein
MVPVMDLSTYGNRVMAVRTLLTGIGFPNLLREEFLWLPMVQEVEQQQQNSTLKVFYLTNLKFSNYSKQLQQITNAIKPSNILRVPLPTSQDY